MNDETKQKINERYERELNKGERFWPDSIFKDLIVSLGIFTLLIILATFVGVAPEAKADPADTSYLPRPEWYFLFLFKFLALYGQIPLIGKIEWLATVLIPGVDNETNAKTGQTLQKIKRHEFPCGGPSSIPRPGALVQRKSDEHAKH